MTSRPRHCRIGAALGPGDPSPQQRHDWVDAGRGLVIVLVVLVHSRDWLATAGLNLQVWEPGQPGVERAADAPVLRRLRPARSEMYRHPVVDAVVREGRCPGV